MDFGKRAVRVALACDKPESMAGVFEYVEPGQRVDQAGALGNLGHGPDQYPKLVISYLVAPHVPLAFRGRVRRRESVRIPCYGLPDDFGELVPGFRSDSAFLALA